MGIEAQGKMVEQVDLDDKKEDKAANEVVDDVLASTLATFLPSKKRLAFRMPLDGKNPLIVFDSFHKRYPSLPILQFFNILTSTIVRFHSPHRKVDF